MVEEAQRPSDKSEGGDRGVWGVLGEAELEGWVTTHIRPEGTPVFILYSLFFLLYYLKRTINDRPYIDLFDLKTDDQWSPLH